MHRQLLVAAFCLTVMTGPRLAMAHATFGAAHVVQEVVLVRHGIRSPTAGPEELAVYASQAWPAWDVAPGQLTEHGVALMRSWGVWYRQRLTSEGLTLTCDNLRVVADSTPRNRDSAAALMHGLAPDCASGYDALAADQTDPLFHGIGKEKKAPDDGSPAFSSSAMTTLQNVLLGCTDRACLEQAKSQGKKVPLLEPPAKALKQAGTLSENLMLEYVQGMPPAQVGWGRADASAVAQMITLHNDAFAFSAKVPDAAAARGGNMLAHIAATLRAAAHAKSDLPTLASRHQRSIILVGHDTDLASAAGLLQLDWHNATQTDDYPPAGALIYQLVERDGQYTVRLFVAQPTLAALRNGNVEHSTAEVVTPLRLPACDRQLECPLARFGAIVDQLVGSSFVLPASGSEPAAK
ncbi:histidine-type phosphatase [Dyella nitratireducens]|uniref:Phosphoanhydride phosphohydrolase n=1 Tax=Dyella nitratireducens TaxID=1849580 RepID=A0ABQ1GT05_9GAMM|nr:histidine-type phosphatase [Dyella nitratireducens]GGA49361.1 phosphoanhydride phosphohydrolase [Dyella nitratireducens]GLQ42189.1 phosphoanhydride phosphohydrolase [Dyella nitratireducens]